MMFKLRYSKEASILEWDNHSFDGCRPCEADAIADKRALNVLERVGRECVCVCCVCEREREGESRSRQYCTKYGTISY